MAELLDEFKEEKEKKEQLLMQIENAKENIETLMNGGMLLSQHGDIFHGMGFLLKVDVEEDDEVSMSVDMFCHLVEYTVPLTDNEKVLMDRIAELEEQVKASGISSLPKRRKIPVTISEDQEMVVVDYYNLNKDKNITIKAIAAKYNISGGLVSKVLEKHKARIPIRRNRQVTYTE